MKSFLVLNSEIFEHENFFILLITHSVHHNGIRVSANEIVQIILINFLFTEYISWHSRDTSNSPQPLNKGLWGILFAAGTRFYRRRA